MPRARDAQLVREFHGRVRAVGPDPPYDLDDLEPFCPAGAAETDEDEVYI